VFFCRRI